MCVLVSVFGNFKSLYGRGGRPTKFPLARGAMDAARPRDRVGTAAAAGSGGAAAAANNPAAACSSSSSSRPPTPERAGSLSGPTGPRTATTTMAAGPSGNSAHHSRPSEGAVSATTSGRSSPALGFATSDVRAPNHTTSCRHCHYINVPRSSLPLRPTHIWVSYPRPAAASGGSSALRGRTRTPHPMIPWPGKSSQHLKSSSAYYCIRT